MRFVSRETGPDGRTDGRSVGSHVAAAVHCTVTHFDWPPVNNTSSIKNILYRQSRIGRQHAARPSQPPLYSQTDRQTDVTVTRYMINAFIGQTVRSLCETDWDISRYWHVSILSAALYGADHLSWLRGTDGTKVTLNGDVKCVSKYGVVLVC